MFSLASSVGCVRRRWGEGAGAGRGVGVSRQASRCRRPDLGVPVQVSRCHRNSGRGSRAPARWTIAGLRGRAGFSCAALLPTQTPFFPLPLHRKASVHALKASQRDCRKARPRAGSPRVARKTRQAGEAAKLTRRATRLSDCGRRAARLSGRGRQNGQAGGAGKTRSPWPSQCCCGAT